MDTNKDYEVLKDGLLVPGFATPNPAGSIVSLSDDDAAAFLADGSIKLLEDTVVTPPATNQVTADLSQVDQPVINPFAQYIGKFWGASQITAIEDTVVTPPATNQVTADLSQVDQPVINPFAQYIGKFWGASQITAIEDTGNTTPDGSAILALHFGPDAGYRVTPKTLVSHVTEVSSDPSQLRQSIGDMIAQDLIVLFQNYSVQIGDIDFVINRFVTSINVRVDQSTAALWKMQLHERTLNDVAAVLSAATASKA